MGLLIKNQCLTIRFLADVKRPEWTIFFFIWQKNLFHYHWQAQNMRAHGLVITKHMRIFRCVGWTQRKLADHEVACQAVRNFPFIKMCL